MPETRFVDPARCRPWTGQPRPAAMLDPEGCADLIASIRAGKAVNEGLQVAESTMAAIAGRMSAYTGRAMKWSWVMNQ